MAATTAANGLKSLEQMAGLSKMFMFTAGNEMTKKLFTEGQQHPRLFKMWIGRNNIVATHPDVARQILIRPDDFKKSVPEKPTYGTPINEILNGGSIVMDNGEKWVAKRKPLDPAFEKSALAAVVPQFCAASQQIVDQWVGTGGGIRDAKRDMSRFALDVLGSAVLGRSFGALEGTFDDTYAKYNYVMTQMMNPFYLVFPSAEVLPTSRNKRYREGLTHMKGVLEDAVEARMAERRAKAEQGIEEDFVPKDMLDMVLGPGLQKDGVVPERDLLGILWIFFIAGHDTTAISLTWLMDFLARNPDVQKRAREEAFAVLNGAENPTAEMLEQVPYISAVISEGLRLRSPVYNLLTRETAKDTELDGYFIPKGTGISIHIGAVNRHPDAYDSPNEFKPERFLAKKEKGVKGPRVFNNLPFSAGPRRCLGDKFSLMEQKTLLLKLLTTCEVLPAGELPKEDEYDTASVPLLFLQPKEMKVRIQPLQK